MTMRAGMVLAIGLALAGRAGAEPLFDLFQKVCVQSNADRQVALSAPELAGWQIPPKALLDTLAKSDRAGGKTTDVDGRISRSGNTFTVLILARSNQIADGINVPADFCALAGTSADPVALKTAASNFAGVPADPSLDDDKDINGFAWRAVGDNHIQLSRAELSNVQADRSVTLLGVASTEKFSLIGLAVPSK